MLQIVEVDQSNPAAIQRYDRLFEDCPDALIQQSSYWGQVIKDLGPDSPFFLICTDGKEDLAGLPLYLYQHKDGNLLTSVPQPGPLGGIFYKPHLTAGKRKEVFQALLTKAYKIATQHKCLALSLVTNPFNQDLELYKEFLLPDFLLENFTQVLPLNEPSHRTHGHRNNLNKAKRNGYRVTFCESPEEIEKWYEVHCKRHQEIGVTPLELQIFKKIFAHLMPLGKAKMIFIWHEGKIVSGGCYICHRRVVDVYMLSANIGKEHANPNFLNTDSSIQWAKEQGLTVYNWQSSQNKHCGVYDYKKQWGSKEVPYYYVTKLLCAPDEILEMGLEKIRQSFSGHFVVPYEAFRDGFSRKYYVKN